MSIHSSVHPTSFPVRYVTLHDGRVTRHSHNNSCSKMLQEEFNRGLECALFACSNLLIREIPSDCKAMLTALKILPLVSRGELAPTKDLVCFRLRFKRELCVIRARVDQKRSFGSRCVFLDGENESVLWNEKDSRTSRSSGLLRSEGCATTEHWMIPSNARSKV